MNSSPSRIVFSYKYHKQVNPPDPIKTLWLSTAMALILVLPALGIFITINDKTNDILSASMVGFGVHFAILAFSVRISSLLEKLFKD